MKEELFASIAMGIWMWFGYEFCSLFLQQYLNVLTRFAIGIPFGFMIFSWIVFILNVKYELTPTLAWFATSVLFLFAALFSVFRNQKEKRSLKNPKFFSFLFSILVPTIFTCYLLTHTVIEGGIISRGAPYGDLPFHLNIINSFVKGCNLKRKSIFDIKSVFYANLKLAYPILVNFLSSVFISCFKLSLRYSIYFPSFPIIFSLFALLNSIVDNFSHNQIACVLAPLLFMFMGGRGFFFFFDKKANDFENHNCDFTHIVWKDDYFYWLHNLFNVILPQRLSLFGIPVSYAYIVVMNNVDFKSTKPFIFAGLLISLMPQLQAHACIAAFEWTLIFGILHFPWTKPSKWMNQIICYLSLGIPALSLSIPQLIPFLSRAHTDGFFSLVPIWVDEKQSFFRLWWDALFLFWVVSIFLGPLLLDKQQMIKYLPSLFVFYVSNFVHYQPWNIDNSKVFHAGWVPLAISVVATYFAIVLKTENSFIQFVSVLIFVCMNFSGALSVYRTHYMTAPQWETGYFPTEYLIDEFVDDVIFLSKPDAVFLTDSFHNHPVPALAGRQVLLGYRGWLSSHGINDTERVKNIHNLMINPSHTEFIDSENVSFLVYNTERQDEIKTDIDNSPFWSLCTKLDRWKIYRRLI